MTQPEVLRLPNGEALPLRTNTARALHGAGRLAQTEVNTPAASVCALSLRVHADTSTSQEQHNHG